MKKIIKRLGFLNTLILGSILMALVTSQWAVGYIDFALDWLGRHIIEYHIYLNVASLIVLTISILVMVYLSGRDNIPSKSAKTKKAGKFLA